MSAPLEAKLRFDRICSEEMLECKKVQNSIGTYKEKRLHIALKRFCCDDPLCYEVKVEPENKPRDIGEKEEGAKHKRRRGSYIADIKCDGHIYEIQTASLYPLKDKIAFYLQHTENYVTVVHPLASVKWVSWIDPESGSISKRHKSPKKEDVRAIARDLYSLAELLGHPRLEIVLPMIEVEEYRNLDGWGNSGKRGSTRYERFPLHLIDLVTLSSKQDYEDCFLPKSLPDRFTAAEYAKASGIRGIATYSALSALCTLGSLRKGEKVGKSYVYERV